MSSLTFARLKRIAFICIRKEIFRSFQPVRKLSAASGIRVDLRSDMVTQPDDNIRQIMAAAVVGDDVFGDDPTTKCLEGYVADMMETEAGLFVPSGTMGNLIAVGVHCKTREEIILGKHSHIFVYEGGGASAMHGIAYHTIDNNADGTMELSAIEEAIRKEDQHYPRTRLVALENTHNICGGRPLSPEYTKSVVQLCAKHGLNFHIDGARLWNAAVSLNVEPSALLPTPKPTQTPISSSSSSSSGGAINTIKTRTSCSLCLSKGLGAPIGSVLVGDKEFIYEARRLRKVLGGGMRQSGVIAAAGLAVLDYPCPLGTSSIIGKRIASTSASTTASVSAGTGSGGGFGGGWRARLSEDHQKAAELAHTISRHPLVTSINDKPCTAPNISNDEEKEAKEADGEVGEEEGGPYTHTNIVYFALCETLLSKSNQSETSPSSSSSSSSSSLYPNHRLCELLSDKYNVHLLPYGNTRHVVRAVANSTASVKDVRYASRCIAKALDEMGTGAGTGTGTGSYSS